MKELNNDARCCQWVFGRMTTTCNSRTTSRRRPLWHLGSAINRLLDRKRHPGDICSRRYLRTPSFKKPHAVAQRMEVGLFLLLAAVLSHTGLATAAATHILQVNDNLIVLSSENTASKRPEMPDNNTPIAVIYPDADEPYGSIFAKIIEGIREQAKGKINIYAIGPNNNAAQLKAQLKRTGTKVVIALGRQGLEAAFGLDRDIAVVVGGVLSVPETASHNLTGISLAPDPALLFVLLKKLLPSTKRVIVIYDPQHNEWLLKLAREAARDQGLDLVAHEAHDLASAARLYETTFLEADSRMDAVWLLQDTTTVDEDTILPLVLKKSWSRSVPVFSSSFLHVKKGALFALYPDNLGLGHDLASSALSVLAGDSRQQGVAPLHEVLTAVNLRTASHIGLSFNNQQRHSFDVVFPEP